MTSTAGSCTGLEPVRGLRRPWKANSAPQASRPAAPLDAPRPRA